MIKGYIKAAPDSFFISSGLIHGIAKCEYPRLKPIFMREQIGVFNDNNYPYLPFNPVNPTRTRIIAYTINPQPSLKCRLIDFFRRK